MHGCSLPCLLTPPHCGTSGGGICSECAARKQSQGEQNWCKERPTVLSHVYSQ